MRLRWTLVGCFLFLVNGALADDDGTEVPADAAVPAVGADGADDSADNEGADDEGAGLDTPLQRNSYAVGVSIGRGLKKDGGELDSALVARGLSDALAGEELLLTNDEVRAAVTIFRKRVKAAAITSAASAEEIAFLKKNAVADDVVLLPGGLQYRVLVDGSGQQPTSKSVTAARWSMGQYSTKRKLNRRPFG